MALRLTSNSLPAPAPAAKPTRSPAALAHAVRAALAARDLAAVRALAAEVSEESDPNLRYHMRKMLVEGAFTAAADAPPAPAREHFVLAATLTLDFLDADPREPVLINYAGVALYELWSLDAARALFKAASRLDPKLPDVRRNLDEVARRGRSAGSRRPMHSAVPELARRARRFAAGLKPAAEQRLSLCMIVKDEEEMLPRCLAAAAPAMDEIIVVDTGSTDRTVEIAERFGARVLHHTWTGSFAEARNVSFEAATGDWIIYLDADEVLLEEDLPRLRSLTTRTFREAFYLTETNFTGEAGDGTAVTHNALRMFRNRAHLRFEGRLHEQIAQHLPAYAPERFEHSGVRMEHFGYLGAVRDAKAKSRRNIELLLAQRAEAPDTAFLRFNLGSEYAAAGDATKALAELERGWTMLEEASEVGDHEFAPTLIVRYVKALRACERNEDALARAGDGLRHFPGFTDLVFEQALAASAMGEREAAIAHYEQCIAMGDAPARYTATRGCGTFMPRVLLAERYTERGELDRALPLLEWCMEHQSWFAGNVLPYATVLLRLGHGAEAVVAAVTDRVQSLTPAMRFLLGTALYEAGHAAAAEDEFREIIAVHPDRAHVLVALGEALLAQRRWGEAAAQAGSVNLEHPLAGASAKTQLFALLTAGRADAVPAALDRARAAGMSEAELGLFTAWSELVRDGETDRAPAPAAIPLLEVMLEALLRVHEFVTFERLLPLLERSVLSPRERHERLAAMYLRRGFLASAAEEWMGVCQQAPDARALIGLAKVAWAHGLVEDAANFATEALNLDPGAGEALVILERLEPAVPVG